MHPNPRIALRCVAQSIDNPGRQTCKEAAKITPEKICDEREKLQ